MKRLLACLLAAAMVLSLVVVPTHEHEHGHVHAVEETEETITTITVGTVIANPGEKVEIPLTLENNIGFANLKIKLKFDEALDAMVEKGEPDDDIGYDFNHDVCMVEETEDGEEIIVIQGAMQMFTLLFSQNNDDNPVTLLFDRMSNSKKNGEIQRISFTLKEGLDPGRYEVYIEEDSFECFSAKASDPDVPVKLVAGAVIIPCADEDHKWVVGETTATCTEAGETTYVCENCTLEEKRPAAALGHTEETIPGKEATCTEPGLTDGVKCSVCGEMISAQEEIPAKGHTAGDPVKENETAPDCDDTGAYDEVVYCAVCGAEISREPVSVPAKGHTEEVIPGKEATCTEPGLTAGVKCSVCGEILTAQEEIPALGHDFVDYVSNEDATCVEDGTETGKCSRCGETDTRTDAGSKEDADHSFPAEYTSDGNATCTADGTKSRVCDLCGEKETVTDEGSALGHTFTNYISDGNATCTEDGTKTAKCERCDVTDTVTDEGSALGHTEEPIPAVAPTCTETGLTEGKKCSVCGVTTVAQEEVPALGHTPGEPVNAKAATEEETGYTGDIYCDVCGDLLEKGEVIPVLDHVHVLNHVDAVAPTCTEDGVVEHWICAKCGAMFSDAEGIHEITSTVDPALGHDFVNYESNGDATCTENGTETGKCSRCDETDTREVADSALGHKFENYVSNNDASCTEDGTKTAKCERCDETDTVTDEGSALGHTEETIPGKAPTCTETGLTDGVKCSVCGVTTVAQEEVPALGHTEETIPGKAPTCTETGLTDGVKCSVCGETLTEQEEIPALGHTEETIPAKEPTCTETGLTEGTKCSVCGEILVAQEEIPALGHGELVHNEEQDPTCGEPGHVEHWFCPICGKYYADPEGTTEIPAEEVEIEALEHTWGEWEITDEPDCTTPGSKTRKCSVCEDVETEEIPALGHDYEDVVTAPTVDAEGYTTHTCKVCGHTYVDSYTPKLDPSNPPTGDEFNFIGMTAMMLLSMTGMAALVLVEKKRNRR